MMTNSADIFEALGMHRNAELLRHFDKPEVPRYADLEAEAGELREELAQARADLALLEKHLCGKCKRTWESM